MDAPAKPDCEVAQPRGAAARVADPDEGITIDELRLAARNHGLPSEALRYDVTPPGLHYVLTHYDIPDLDPNRWHLTIGGAVARRASFDLAELQSRASRTIRVTMECAGNGRAGYEPRPISQPWLTDAVGTADWTGVPLTTLLQAADVRPDAVDVVFTGADHGWERGVEQDYQRALPLAEALANDVLVAVAMNGGPLPLQHGFPARLIVPGWYGMAHVKWLISIVVTTEPFAGFQNEVAYRLRRDTGEHGDPVTRIEPRAALVPPGTPDFMTRARFVRAGRVALTGRAWSGWAPITGVEVSVDGGNNWSPASLDDSPTTAGVWRGFAFDWDAGPGSHVLMARAIDASGREQPVSAAWNRGGFANNSVQAIDVIVID